MSDPEALSHHSIWFSLSIEMNFILLGSPGALLVSCLSWTLPHKAFNLEDVWFPGEDTSGEIVSLPRCLGTLQRLAWAGNCAFIWLSFNNLKKDTYACHEKYRFSKCPSHSFLLPGCSYAYILEPVKSLLLGYVIASIRSSLRPCLVLHTVSILCTLSEFASACALWEAWCSLADLLDLSRGCNQSFGLSTALCCY